MGDDYDPDYDGDYMDFDDGWMYVEDEYGLADELAESQIPEPGYAGTNGDIMMEEYEYDLYDYWDDLEYADDPYWDGEGRPRSTASAPEKAGQKRKRGAPAKGASVVDKRRKVSAVHRTGGGLEDTQMNTVIYMSSTEKCRLAMRPPPLLKGKATVAFLSDWRKRFANKDGVVRTASMPVAMQRAAQAKDEDTPPKVRHHDATAEVQDGEDEEWEDEDAAEDLEVAAEMANELASLDPEMLKAILKQKLGEAGLDGADEAAFMSTISKMLAGEGTDDDAMGELANMLLGKATGEDGDAALSGWLSREGVQLEADDDDDEEEADDGEASSEKQEASVAAKGGKTTQMAMHTGSPEAKEPRRSRKRKSVRFDVPPDDSAGSLQDEQEADMPGLLPTPPSSEDAVDADPTATATAASKRQIKAVRHESSEDAAETMTTIRATPEDQLEQELNQDAQTEGVEHAPRQTRKRKAIVDNGEEDTTHGDAGRRAVKEPATKRTRNARAKGGK